MNVTTLADITQLVDSYIRKKTERLAADKVAERLKKEENAFKEQLFLVRAESGAKSLGGTLGTLNYDRKMKPRVENWDIFYEYIYAHKAFELLQRRLGEAAVHERWEDDITVPGVIAFPVDDFTISGKT